MPSAYRDAVNHALAELRGGHVVAQRWEDGRLIFYPRGSRLGHAADVPSWERVTHGTVVAVTTMREHSYPDHQAETPFTLVLVEVEDARLICRLAASTAVPAVGSTVALHADVHSGAVRIIAS